MTHRPGEPGPQAGGMTLVAAALIAALVCAGAVVATAAAGRIDAHTAQVAADMAALSGATTLWRGASPCRVAATYARANGADMTGCTITTGGDVTVTVETGGQPATATAGPA